MQYRTGKRKLTDVARQSSFGLAKSESCEIFAAFFARRRVFLVGSLRPKLRLRDCYKHCRHGPHCRPTKVPLQHRDIFINFDEELPHGQPEA